MVLPGSPLVHGNRLAATARLPYCCEPVIEGPHLSDILEILREALAGRYAVERELGRGGMATVYFAQDIKHQRAVAIKVLDPDLAHAVGAERFLREIEIAGRLQHPHILPLYDSGSANGLLFYVMPYVEGETLRSRLDREKQISIEEAVRVTTEVASALGYAHSRGVIHRDIKPENIMLSTGLAIVADFGIARAVGGADSTSLTSTGTIIGTPAYMSPEQSTGSPVDGRSDIYSLGCVLYEMLVGEPPFTGLTAQAIIARHSLDMVSPPTIVRASIPDAVEDAILKALAKVPADRFTTASQLAEALAVPSLATGPRRRTTQAVPARRPLPKVGLAIAAAAVAIFGGWMTLNARRATRTLATPVDSLMDPRHVAVLYFDQLSPTRDLSYVADGLTEALIDELAPVQSLRVISRNGVAPFRHQEIARDSIARALKVGTLIAGSVEPAGNRLRVTVRLIDGASGVDIERKSFELPDGDLLGARQQLAQQADGFLRRRLGEEIRVREQKAGTENVAAWTLVQQAERARKDADSLAADPGAVTSALGRADSLLSLAQSADPAWVEPAILRGFVAYRMSRVNGNDDIAANPAIERGLTHAARALQLEPNNARAHELRGTLRYWRWLLHLVSDPEQARALLRDAEEDLRTAVRLDPSLASVWSALSHLDYQKSDVVQAKIDAQRAYEADAYYASADQVLWRLFSSSYDLGQSVDAVHWCEEGNRRFPANPRFTECQLWLMASKAREPDPARAWTLLDQWGKLGSPVTWPFDKLRGQIIVAAVLARAGQADSARTVLVHSRGNREIDPAHDLLYNEAFVRTLLGDRDEAIRLLRNFIAARPERRSDLATEYEWWFRDLHADPRFQELIQVKR
jgi:serine/threonine-protein kinase